MHDAISSIVYLNYDTAIRVALSRCVSWPLFPRYRTCRLLAVSAAFFIAPVAGTVESEQQNQLVFRFLERSTGVSLIRRIYELEAPPV